MNKTWRVCRYLLLWGLPALVSLIVLIFGFMYWSVSTQVGTRWTLRMAAQQFDGNAQGVHGTLASGVYVEGLSLSLPDLDVRVVGLHLQAEWPALLHRKLQITDLSAVQVSLDRHVSAQVDSEPSPVQFPSLPVEIQVDRLALNALDIRQDGERLLPVDLLAFSAAVSLDQHAAHVRLDKLDAAWRDMLISLSGKFDTYGLAAPWPLELNLHGFAQERHADSPLCLRQYLGRTADAVDPLRVCRVDAQVRLSGSLDSLTLSAQGRGEGLDLDVRTDLFPKRPFPLGQTRLALSLPGNAALSLDVDPASADATGARTVQVQLAARSLDLKAWLPDVLGASMLSAQARAHIGLDAQQRVQNLGAELAFDSGSRWNGQALSGAVKLERLAAVSGALFDAESAHLFDPSGLALSGLDVNLVLGTDRVRAKGEIAKGRTQLDLNVQAPHLAALWPQLPGGVTIQSVLAGTLARHTLSLDARYTPDHAREGVVGEAPATAKLRLAGGWDDRPETAGWRGALEALDVSHADLSVHSARPIALQYLLAPDASGRQWRVGAGQLQLELADEPMLSLDHASTSGAGAHWATSGQIAELVVSPERIERIQAWLARGASKKGGVQTALSEQARRSRLTSKVEWSLSFEDALTGAIHVQRTDGDLVVPGDVPIELGLQKAALDVGIVRRAAGLSAVDAVLDVETRKMGNMRVQFQTPLHAAPGGGLSVREQDVKTVHVQAESEDLAWMNLFLQGGIEVGGTVHADVQGRSLPNGRWSLSGPVSGEGMSVLSVDQGVRLLDGTLQAHFDNDRVVLDSLRFPAQLRVTPKEWRTAEWVSKNPDAKDGSLTLSGQWNLFDQAGDVTVDLRRYPILQRSDRYAMISGRLMIDSTLPQVSVRGSIQADAGWFDLDILNNIPTLDGDVVVLEPGQQVAIEPVAPLDVDVELDVDLGPRFYLTGFGVNSGLVGRLTIKMKQGKLTGMGALRTRGGSIDAYGQHLQLRRGTVTFQGDITNPVISIEALRTGVAVQAGVRVAGTARRPRIDLVSYPDVNESEKLTWLLLGHGPDDAGGDMALLFSVGSSFLTEGEPFYKRFGIDEFSMRSGELGSTGSILPVESVVGGLASGTSDIERRFALASKTLTKDLKVSIEQALSQTGTVGRMSYRLMRGLRAEITAGTVTGLALVYRWFSAD